MQNKTFSHELEAQRLKEFYKQISFLQQSILEGSSYARCD